MDQYIIDDNLGLDTLAERITVRKKDSEKMHQLSKMELMDMATTAVAYREYLPLLKLSYENVASYTDVFTSMDYKISASYINLISEYFPMGHLDKYLRKLRSERQALDQQLVDIWFAQILDGLMYLWNQNMTHRNIKPDSIYLRGENNEESCSLVIGDLIPASVAYDLRMRTRLPRRALSYTAPEIFEGGDYSIQSDIYSFGCVILDMITCDTLTDEETLQLRICARHDLNTLTETLENLKETHEVLPTLIGGMMNPDPEQRMTVVDIRRDDYVIESMHNIDSNQVKYPSARDAKWARDGIRKNEKLEYYLNYLQQHRNKESRVEYALQLCNQSKSIDLSTLASSFRRDILPVVEHFNSNPTIVENTLELLQKIIYDNGIITSQIVTFVTKMVPIFENDEHLTGKIADILIKLATANAKLLLNARITSDLVQLMSKHEEHADISGKCCTLLWLMSKESITKDYHRYHVPILSILFNILRKHPDNSDVFTKVCFAFLPLIFERSTVDYLAQFNLVRYFTIGLEKHRENRKAIKAVVYLFILKTDRSLMVLTELFQRDERCVLRFLCSRSLDNEQLMDSMSSLTKIFDRYKNHGDIARGIVRLLKSLSSYDDAIDEMISTKIERGLLYEIKRFHSDHTEIAQSCEEMMIRIRQRS